ncbi:MAG: cystathionine beta-lyase, partial [Lachnospiraceae bacterium]|nr:cystathionine beta-lyase [Lachnospiraceae bacterium]
YLMWLDLSSLPGSGKEIGSFLRKKTGLYLTDGGLYGTGGESFLRMNLACPRSMVEDGMRRMQEGIAVYKTL